MRTRSNIPRHKRRRKILKAARGFRGSRKNLLRNAKDGVQRALNYAYIGRKQRKRDFRALWITRIGAAARANGMSYSRLMGQLIKADVQLDRKSLAELAVSDPAAFTRVLESVRAAE